MALTVSSARNLFDGRRSRGVLSYWATGLLLLPLLVLAVPSVQASTLGNFTATGNPQTTGKDATWTFSFTNPQTIPTNGKIVVVFPEGFSIAVGNNPACTITVAGITIVEESSDDNVRTVTCTITATVPTGGIPANSGISLQWTVIRSPTTVRNPTGAFDVRTFNAVPTELDTHLTNTEVITASDFTDVSITAGSLFTGAVNTYTVSFDVVNAVQATGDIRVVFPAGYQTSSGATVCDVRSDVGDKLETTTVVSATEVVCNLQTGIENSPTPEDITVTLTNIKNSIASGATAPFTIETRNTTDVVHDHRVDQIVTLTASPLKDVAVWAPKRTAGEVETWSFNFTTTNSVPNNGNITVTLPTGFELSSGGTSTCDVTVPSGITGEVATISQGGKDLSCRLPTSTIGANAAVKMSVTRIKNPVTAKAQTGTFSVSTVTNTGRTIDTDANEKSSILPHPFATGPTASLPKVAKNVINDDTFTFKTFNAWEANGKIEITFPTGFTFNQRGSGTTQISFVSGGSGTFGAATISGQKITATRQGGSQINADTTVTLKVTAVRNPATAQTTGTFLVTTVDNAGGIHDSGTAPGVTIYDEEPTPSTTPTSTTSSTTTPSSTSSEETIDETNTGTTRTITSGTTSKKKSPGFEALVVVAAIAAALVVLVRRRDD